MSDSYDWAKDDKFIGEQFDHRGIKGQLLTNGQNLISKWCLLNEVRIPRVVVNWDTPPEFGVCAYYQDDEINIWPQACAALGMAGRAWSYPGYVVDRTPYGVLAHELGHHVDEAHGARGGQRARQWLLEASLTGYDINLNERFAEMFRLFVTNPSLLMEIRPRFYAFADKEWPRHAETRYWTEVLAEVPRQLNAARNKVRQAERQTPLF